MTSVGMAAMMHGLVQGGPPVRAGLARSRSPIRSISRSGCVAPASPSVTVSCVDSTAGAFADADEHVDVVLALSPPLAGVVRTASPDKIAALRSTVAGLDAQYLAEDGVRLPSQAFLCVAE